MWVYWKVLTPTKTFLMINLRWAKLWWISGLNMCNNIYISKILVIPFFVGSRTFQHSLVCLYICVCMCVYIYIYIYMYTCKSFNFQSKITFSFSAKYFAQNRQPLFKFFFFSYLIILFVLANFFLLSLDYSFFSFFFFFFYFSYI